MFRQVTNGQDRLIYKELFDQAGADVDDTGDGEVWRLRATKGDRRVEVHRDGWGLRTAAFVKRCDVWHSEIVEKGSLLQWLAGR